MKDRRFYFHFVFLWLFLPTAYCLLPTFLCTAQEKSEVLKYARTIVDTLASPSMHGRGYVNKGDSIAADFIKKEFEKIGVKPIGKELYQRFTLAVNTFPDSKPVHLSFKSLKKNTKLIPGKNFLIKSSSPELSKEYPWKDNYAAICYLNRAFLKEKKIHSFFKDPNNYNPIIVMNEVGIKNKAKVRLLEDFIVKTSEADCIVILTDEKLTWSVSQKTERIPVFIIHVSDSIRLTKRCDVMIGYESKLIPNYSSQNIIGHIKGTHYSDSFIVFSAHYDHLGRMGKDVYFPGANDNASGCAMLLNLARYYSQHPPKYSVAFMAFGAEEAGLVGSKYYVEHPLFPLRQIKFLVNMDIMGTGDEGIKVVNATEHKTEFDKLVEINKEKNLLPSVQPRGKAANSDHYFFSEAGVKTFFIYTLGGIKAYHDIYDRAETLPLTKFEEAFKLLTEFSDHLQK